MKKILFFLAAISLQAQTVLDIVAEQKVLPKIKILSGANVNSNFDRVLKNDLIISSKFELVNDEKSNYTLIYYLNEDNNNYFLKLDLKDENDKIQYSSNFTSSKDAYVFLSHKAISKMIKDLKIDNIDWMNQKILMTKKTAAKQSEIVIADYTLMYQKKILSNGLNLFAKWANKEQDSFYYTDYNNDELVLYKYDLSKNKKEFILKSTGMLALSDISDDNKFALITKTNNDQPDIFLLNLENKSTKQLTKYNGIDVSAKFLGKDAFVFVSDRAAYPNLYMQDINTNSISQLVYHGKNNSAFSIHGDLIVYSSRDEERNFHLFILDTKSQQVRQLTLNGRNIFPQFSADGKTIMFIKNMGRESAVGILRLDENKIFNFPLKLGKISTLDW